MTHEQPAEAPRRSWRKRLLVWGALLVAFLAIAWITFGLIVERRLAAEIARIRDAGEPLTWHELHDDLTTTGAGLEYQAAFEELDRIAAELMPSAEADPPSPLDKALAEAIEKGASKPMSEEELMQMLEASEEKPKPLEAMTPDDQVLELIKRVQRGDATDEDLVHARRLLSRHESVFDRLDRAAAMDQISFDLGADEGLLGEMPALGQSRRAASLLLLRGLVQAREGDLTGAADTALSLFQLARITADQPVLIVYLVRLEFFGHGARLIADISTFGLPSPQKTRELETAIIASMMDVGFARAVIGERILGFQAISDLTADNSGMPWPVVELWTYYYLADMSHALSSARLPWPQRAQAPDVEPTGLLSALLIPAIPTAGLREPTARATLRAARVGLAIAAYRRDKGGLPAELHALVPEYLPSVPLDPFNDEPLRYVVKDHRYVVYGVGEDGRDDGGDVRLITNDWSEDPADEGISFSVR